MKYINFPSFEEWKSKAYDFHNLIGVYGCAIIRDPPDDICEDKHFYTAAIGVGLVPERPVRESILILKFECADEDEVSLREWYNTVQKCLNIHWEAYITATYLVED